ncbi:unnamed protein product [Lactuca saligna]|uniref:Uncharacterized protein n=1 Tax=Lactuca saligna TaxID=75948 RepID=A0AA35YAD4_LACSI|nr:unnamed protein product [Lactuca saligna]
MLFSVAPSPIEASFNIKAILESQEVSVCFCIIVTVPSMIGSLELFQIEQTSERKNIGTSRTRESYRLEQMGCWCCERSIIGATVRYNLLGCATTSGMCGSEMLAVKAELWQKKEEKIESVGSGRCKSRSEVVSAGIDRRWEETSWWRRSGGGCRSSEGVGWKRS